MEAQRYNVLLDLNGTLIYRIHSIVQDLRGMCEGEVVIKGRVHYKRLCSSPLFRELNKRLNVYIYTSMMKHNAETCLQTLYPGYTEHIKGILAREYNKPDMSWTLSSLT